MLFNACNWSSDNKENVLDVIEYKSILQLA